MTTTTPGAAVRSFGTRLLRTEVHVVDGRHRWTRSPGPDAPAPFRTLTPAWTARIARATTDGPVDWAPGTVAGAGATHLVRGPRAVAGRLLVEGPDAELPDRLRGTGQLLAALHRTGADDPPDDDPPPPGLDRLTTWLQGRAAVPQAAFAQSFLRPRLGDEMLAELDRVCRELGSPTSADAAPCHGAPGLGSLVPAPDGQPGAADLLVGGDVGRASWQWDLGWVLGELIELRWTRNQDPAQPWSATVDALYEGYGRDLGDRWQVLVALRVLLHLHDYTAYVGLDRATVLRYVDFARFLLDASTR